MAEIVNVRSGNEVFLVQVWGINGEHLCGWVHEHTIASGSHGYKKGDYISAELVLGEWRAEPNQLRIPVSPKPFSFAQTFHRSDTEPKYDFARHPPAAESWKLTEIDKAQPKRGFAETPPVLRYGGPQMEDYPDWDSWYFARQMWVLKRMLNEQDSLPN